MRSWNQIRKKENKIYRKFSEVINQSKLFAFSVAVVPNQRNDDLNLKTLHHHFGLKRFCRVKGKF